jgi:hypothetical protein
MILCMMVVISYLVLWDLVPLSVVIQFTGDFIVTFMTLCLHRTEFQFTQTTCSAIITCVVDTQVIQIFVFSAPALQLGRNTVYHDLQNQLVRMSLKRL